MKAALRTLILTVAATAAASGMTNVMSVDPVKASWSAFGDTIAQLITLNVDTLKRVEVFVGFSEGAGAYNVNIYSYPDGTEELAQALDVPLGRPHSWLRFDLTVSNPDSFMKGRRYRVEVTRSGADSIQYYWADEDNGGPYKYGEMLVGGVPQEYWDLAARVYGRNTPLYSLRWGSHVWTLTALMPAKPFGGWGDGIGGPARAACAAEAGIRLDRDYVSMHVLWPDGCPDRTDPTLCFLPALPTPA